MNYQDTTLVIDCSEVQIEKPFALQAQRNMFSSCKHYNTVKFLLAITPAGLVCFVSDIFAGASSDKGSVWFRIFERAVPGHVIMADKGFQIENLLPVDIQLNNPQTFIKKWDGKMPEADVCETREIASERVHVERAIRRVKTYHILDRVIPLSMCDIANQIVTVCVLLKNFKPALIKSFNSSSSSPNTSEQTQSDVIVSNMSWGMFIKSITI